MKHVQAYIDTKQEAFSHHPFFEVLEGLETLEEVSYFVPELTFWAMTFQDILRINEARVTTPYLKKIARHHRLEDAGHEKWFLHDKKYMGENSIDKYCAADNVTWLYSQEMEVTRDAAYRILAEIYQTQDERVNIAMLLTLESSGHVFFEKVVRQVRKIGQDASLKYFSSSHLEVELAHALFEEEMEKQLFSKPLPVRVRRQALQMVDRCYDAFNDMFDGLIIACTRRLELAKQRNQHVAANTANISDAAEQAAS